MYSRYSRFLTHETTWAASDQDLQHWHKGIPWYGFWAVLITQAEWLALIRAAQMHMQHYLLPGYARQPHITISASGLLAEQHFSGSHLQRQQQLLNRPSHAFTVRAAQLNSFPGAPYLAIEDSDQGLLDLRSRLGAIKADDEPASYHAHITLGLYRDRFPSSEIVNQLSAFKVPELPVLEVNSISFCRYQTNCLQGSIEETKRFKLFDPVTHSSF